MGTLLIRTIISCTLLLYLGATILKDVSWAEHIDTVSSCRNSMPAQLYNSLFLSILDYCSSVQDLNTPLYTDKVESVQNFATKVITKTVALSLGALTWMLK